MIEFRLTKAKALHLGNEVHIANYVIAHLKESGVPVVGCLIPRVTTGVLEVLEDNFATDDTIFRWRPE